ncbi:MAG: hypothetical protein UW69_C0017G0005 [Microgenomates group bacterium GW2011_GWA2_44_7]|nr:MAG: hypothetical protein UW69_C0017G0005 [Microgenomates group bacterium GW2011_GWA2_44_7]
MVSTKIKKWQKALIYGLIVFSLLHILRDLLQDLGIRNTFSSIFTKRSDSYVAFILGRTVVNTYIVAPVVIGLSTFCLARNKFGLIGYLTIIIMAISFSGWLYYWFFL